MIDEIKSLPESKVSSARELYRRGMGKYTKLGTNAKAAVRALQVDLARSGTTISNLCEEADFAISQAFGERNEWTRVTVYPKINRIVAMVSARVFLGQPVSRNEEWISLATEWTSNLFALITTTARYPAWLRPWIAPYLSETMKALELRARAKAILAPVLSAQLDAIANDLPPPETMRDTLASWMMKYVAPRHMNVESLVRHQLSFSFAAIHTTTHTLYNILFDLAAMPQYQHELREELKRVLKGCGGDLTQGDLIKLRKMDSFMRESQRFNPTNVVVPMRLTVEPLTLSTGQIIPAGTPLGFFNMSINQSNSLYKYPPAEAFDGYRFGRMREAKEHENKHQFGCTGPAESFNFGHGIHACPGRFLAAAEIKVMLVYVLQNYDLKLTEGEARPVSRVEEVWFSVEKSASLLLRSREKV
ncbi:cytochrome P450 [Hyaloscypha hepaticicola]|uniref:Cytochrome P450 n=1 Tax=Hyaloscypha hepaticicola TaxID=2082293 RepID=A0A2J6Q963_9HELO|nr:cytochrome P450 [Hyaloscypha hepaticicola]